MPPKGRKKKGDKTQEPPAKSKKTQPEDSGDETDAPPSQGKCSQKQAKQKDVTQKPEKAGASIKGKCPPGKKPKSCITVVEQGPEEEVVDLSPDEEDDEPEILEEDEEEDDVQSQSQSQSQSHVKYHTARRKSYVTLDEPVEEEIINWVKDHPMLYDKSLGAYRKCKDKKQMWTDKGKEYGLSYEDIITWYESLRTRYGRLTKKKSGAGAKKHTERETWILKNFQFLDLHIHRQPSRASCSVSTFFIYKKPHDIA